MTRVEHIMGMPVGITVRSAACAAAVEDAFGWLRWVDATFSTYRTDSEISRLARGELRMDDCCPEVIEVLARCAELGTQTDGYFSAWAAGALDPSGYVKGWAVERLSARLPMDHCVNAGGDVRVRGGSDWRVGIRHPSCDQVCYVLTAADLAVATSGTYERGPHIVDPHTGRPETALGSVTVTGPDLGIADAYATALYAMGRDAPDFAARLAAETPYDVLLIERDGSALRTAGLLGS